MFTEPQVVARGMKIEVSHPSAGKVSLVGSPMRFAATPLKHDMPPPTLGQHTVELLRRMLDKSDTDIAALRANGVI